MRALARRAAAAACAALALALLHAPAAAQAAAAKDVSVQVVKDGNAVSVDASLFAPVPVHTAWDVLSDFDHMAEFVPNLERSRIVSQPGEPLVVEQKGVARFGIFRLSFETVRAIELQPQKAIRTRLIRGNMKKMEGTLRIDAESGGTRIAYHADAIAGFWLPPLLGTAFIRHEVTEQFTAIVAEMARRGGTAEGNR